MTLISSKLVCGIEERVSPETLFFIREKHNFFYGMIIKEENNMITFSILLIALLIITIVTAVIALACGAGFIAVFGDLIVCGLLI